jgi:hypothetical protein
VQALIALGAFIAGYALVFAEGGIAAAKIERSLIASAYADLALSSATGTLLNYARVRVAAQGAGALAAPGALPIGGPVAICAAQPPRPCPFVAVASYRIAGASADGDGPSFSPGVQRAVFEGRISAEIVVSLATRGGAAGAVKARAVTLRTFGVPPYVALTGSRDAGAAIGAAGAGQGDSAGNAAEPGGYADPSDTGMHLQLLCRQAPYPAGQAVPDRIVERVPYNEGLPWGTGGQAVEAPCDIAAESVDRFVPQHWNVGTQNASGWSQ